MSRRGYGYAIAFFMLLGVIDSLLTYFGVNFLGLIEGNALMNFLIEKSWGFFFFFKIAVYGLLAKASLTFNHFPSGPLIAFLGAGVVSWNSLMILLTI
jgi:hypothetical protein